MPAKLTRGAAYDDDNGNGNDKEEGDKRQSAALLYQQADVRREAHGRLTRSCNGDARVPP